MNGTCNLILLLVLRLFLLQAVETTFARAKLGADNTTLVAFTVLFLTSTFLAVTAFSVLFVCGLLS